MGKPRIGKLRSLSSKYSAFTSILLLWVVATSLWWDIHLHTFDWTKGLILCGVVLVVAAAISQFTNRLLARPLTLLEAGITSVREGRLEPIRVSRTGDEVEYLGESFNRMITALAASQEEIRQYQELLEERIRQRTQELEKAMHGALAASQAKSEFLANISHELRTPMNGLLGMLDLVLDSPVGGEQREQVEIAQRCAYSLLDLLNDILDLSKIEAGRMILEKVPFDLRSVAEDCVRAQSAKAQQKGVELRFEYNGDVTNVTGDPLRLRQIVANLLSNAIKFTEKGSVSVRQSVLEGADGKLSMVLDVVDTGAGIPADKVPLIFEKFTQADSSISRKYGGTGLGLAITKRLVELQGGQIRVESRVGRGSTFTVEIPFETAPAAETAVEPLSEQRAAVPAAKQVRLLLVEDNAVNQRVVLAMLRKKNYAIDVANNGQEALEKLKHAAEPVQRGSDGCPDAGTGWSRNDQGHPPQRQLGLSADHRHDRARHDRGSRALPAGGHERLYLQAGAAGRLDRGDRTVSGVRNRPVRRTASQRRGTNADVENDARRQGPGQRNASPVHGSGAGAA